MKRVVVVGSSGAGKSTLARAIAARIGGTHIELDAFMHQADWQPLPADEFRARVEQAMVDDRWVSDGNYAVVREQLWLCADTVVWLDYPRWLTTSRVIRRTIQRSVRSEELWNGNREDWRGMFRRDPEQNVVLWSFTRFHKVRATYESRTTDRANSHLTVHRFTHPAQAEAFLASLPAG